MAGGEMSASERDFRGGGGALSISHAGSKQV